MGKEQYNAKIYRFQKDRRAKLRKLIIKGFPGVEKLVDEVFYQFQSLFIVIFNLIQLKKAKEGELIINEFKPGNRCIMIKKGSCSIWKAKTFDTAIKWVKSKTFDAPYFYFKIALTKKKEIHLRL